MFADEFEFDVPPPARGAAPVFPRRSDGKPIGLGRAL